MTRYEKIRYILTPAIGFGVGGALWGWECFRGTVGVEEGGVPFSFVLGIVFLGVFGGASLILFSRDIKKIIKVVLLGIGGWMVGFLVPAIFAYYLYLFGTALWHPLLIISYIVDKIGVLFSPSFSYGVEFYDGFINRFTELSYLKPSFSVGSFWLEFLFTGIIISFFYALILRNKIWPIMWRGAGGFAFGAIIGPIIGNSLGNNSIFASYIITFSVIGVILGVFLGWGVWSGRRDNLRVD